MEAIAEYVRGKVADSDMQRIKFRCSHCRIGCSSVCFPWTPRISKYHCRKCGQDSDVRLRDSSYDDLDGHIEEGEHQAKMRRQTSFIIGSPGQLKNDKRKLRVSRIQTKQLGGAILLDLE